MIQSVYQTKIQSLDKTTPKQTRILQFFDADVTLPRSLKIERTEHQAQLYILTVTFSV